MFHLRSSAWCLLPWAQPRAVDAVIATARTRPAWSIPAPTGSFKAKLLSYLVKRLGRANLEFSTAPEEIVHGWETYTFRFQLKPTNGLPRPLVGPLVIRVYANANGRDRAAKECLVQQHLGQLGYPVARPILFEESCEALGGPFLLMPELPGQTLFHALLRKPWLIFAAPSKMAVAHAQLHQLPPEAFPDKDRPMLARSLERMGDVIERYDCKGLLAGLEWLRANQPAEQGADRIVHLDFHPINLVYCPGKPLAVLDWAEARVGDVHADVATTLMLMECVTLEGTHRIQQMTIAVGRFFLRRWYLRAYRWRCPLDSAKLAYYRAWAAFRRLCAYAVWLADSPLSTGSKPTSLRHLTPQHVRKLEAYFQRWTGVEVSLQDQLSKGSPSMVGAARPSKSLAC